MNKMMYKKFLKKCGACKFWDIEHPVNVAMAILDAECMSKMAQNRVIGYLITHSTFGCVFWKPRGLLK
jgi:hypothetical protein